MRKHIKMFLLMASISTGVLAHDDGLVAPEQSYFKNCNLAYDRAIELKNFLESIVEKVSGISLYQMQSVYMTALVDVPYLIEEQSCETTTEEIEGEFREVVADLELEDVIKNIPY